MCNTAHLCYTIRMVVITEFASAIQCKEVQQPSAKFEQKLSLQPQDQSLLDKNDKLEKKVKSLKTGMDIAETAVTIICVNLYISLSKEGHAAYVITNKCSHCVQKLFHEVVVVFWIPDSRSLGLVLLYVYSTGPYSLYSHTLVSF